MTNSEFKDVAVEQATNLTVIAENQSAVETLAVSEIKNSSVSKITPELVSAPESLNTLPQEKKGEIVALTIKVSAKDRSSWKVYAAQHDVTLTVLIRHAVNVFVKK